VLVIFPKVAEGYEEAGRLKFGVFDRLNTSILACRFTPCRSPKFLNTDGSK
jgi:hypothetical protein